MVLVWMRFVQRRAVPGLAWVAAGTAVFGTALVTRAWEYQTLDAVGVMFGLGAAITFAGYLIMGERLGKRLPGLTVGAYGFAMSALLLLLLAPVEIPQAGLGGWMQLGWIALGGTVAPFMLALAALRLTDPGRVGVLSTMEPPVAALAAWLLLGQVLSGVQVVGGLVVIASVATVQHVTSSVAPDARSPQAV
jgi:drug/metabolite transporter (DMT)-like permease